MALMEAGLSKPRDAMNAAGAMVNRSSMAGEPLGAHVSKSIYQPTIEQNQRARLGEILASPQFRQMTDWVEGRRSGRIDDPVGGATHFLAKPQTMLALEAREPNKYKNWGPRGANWTGYNPNTGQYSNQVFEDSSHAFLAPEGTHSYMGADFMWNNPQPGMTTVDGRTVPNSAVIPNIAKALVGNGGAAGVDPLMVYSAQFPGGGAQTPNRGVTVTAPAAPAPTVGTVNPKLAAILAGLDAPDGTGKSRAERLQNMADNISAKSWMDVAAKGLGSLFSGMAQADAAREEKAYSKRLGDAIAAAGDDPAALRALMSRIAPAKALESALSPKAHDWQVNADLGVMIDKNTGEVRKLDAKKEEKTQDTIEWNTVNLERKRAGKPPMAFEDFLKSKKSAPAAEFGWTQDADGKLVPTPGGPKDPAYIKNTSEAKRADLTPDERKAILESEEALSAGNAAENKLNSMMGLSKRAFSGPGAQTLGYATSFFGSDAGEATEELTSLATSQVLDNLKATFGANPTEGERKVMLDVQGSVNKAPKVREEIYGRAIEAIQARKGVMRDRANQIRSGDFFKPGGGISGPAASPTQTAPAPQASTPQGDPLAAARDAIAKGAPRDAVIKRLQDNGIDPTGL